MSTATLWWVILGCILVTAAIKAVGPVALGGRQLPRRARGVVALAAPALLTALVATSLFSSGRQWSVGVEAVGVGLAAVLLWFRASLLVAAGVAVGTTALLRALL